MVNLRPYQQNIEQKIVSALTRGYDDTPLAVMPCGSGKTVLFSKIAGDFDGPVALIVHRQELVAQISLTLASFGIAHDLVTPKNVARYIVKQHIKHYGRSYYNDRKNIKVGGVDTIIRRKDHDFEQWAKTVGLWVQDEAHHVLKDNKWGKAANVFKNAVGLGVTATPERTDGKGLGSHSDGVFNELIVGPDLRWMINEGYLTDYKIYAPPSDVDYNGLGVTAGGDYNAQLLSEREQKSHIFGDVADHFKRIAPGKQGITFASSLKSASRFALEFNNAGVMAEMVSGESKDAERFKADQAFRAGQLRQLTNVDLFGEGYDLPVLDCVSMARKTESFSLFVQQSTRALRPLYAPNMPLDTKEQRRAAIAASDKPTAFIIDHVGNVERHAVARDGIVDLCYRNWTLDRREKKAKGAPVENTVPVKTCTNPICAAAYSALLLACPICGDEPKKQQRNDPKEVDGDLTELNPAALKQIKTEIARQQAPFKGRLTGHALAGATKRHRERQQASDDLRHEIALWAGKHRAAGDQDQQIMKRFFYTFGVDLLTCQTQSASDQIALKERIQNDRY